MEGVKFVDVLKSYEKKVEDEDYKSKEKDYNEKKTIENDINRLVFVGVDVNNSKKVLLLKRVLYSTLESLPTEYTQGITEMSSVFLLYYFEEIVDTELSNNNASVIESNNEDSDQGTEADNSTIANQTLDKDSTIMLESTQCYINPDLKDKESVTEFLKKHSKVYETLRIVLTNVIRRKFDPLIEDNFKIYKNHMKVFIEMMKSRNENISELGSHVFMGTILTFFLRKVNNMKDAHKIFEIVLSCPDTSLFLLLVEFFDEVKETNKKIVNVDENLYDRIIELEKEFIATKKRMDEGKEDKGFGVKHALVVGGIVSVAAAAFIYRMTKKE